MHSDGLLMWWLKNQRDQELREAAAERPALYAHPPELVRPAEIDPEKDSNDSTPRVIIIDL